MVPDDRIEAAVERIEAAWRARQEGDPQVLVEAYGLLLDIPRAEAALLASILRGGAQ